MISTVESPKLLEEFLYNVFETKLDGFTCTYLNKLEIKVILLPPQVTGGCSSNCLFHLKDTSFFSFVTETWTELAPMNTGRMGHKMTIINGKPTVIGGFDHGELNTIEEFDGTSWSLRAVWTCSSWPGSTTTAGPASGGHR